MVQRPLASWSQSGSSVTSRAAPAIWPSKAEVVKVLSDPVVIKGRQGSKVPLAARTPVQGYISVEPLVVMSFSLERASAIAAVTVGDSIL